MKDHDKIREVAHDLAKNLSRGVHTYGSCVNGLEDCVQARGSGKCRRCLDKELIVLVGENLAEEYYFSLVDVADARLASERAYENLFNP